MMRWQELTTDELGALAGEASVAVLPIGAVEQHGPHLPLSTDTDIAVGLADAAVARLPAAMPVLVLPVVSVTASAEHERFPGTLTLEPETALAVIEQLGRSVARAGIRRLVLLNAHGGNRPVVDLAALRLRRELEMLAVRAHYFRLAPPQGLVPERECRHGLHGGLVETAMMLYLKPDAVGMARARDNASLGERLAERNRYLEPEGETAFAWMAQDLHPDGVAGDAAGADAALGERLVGHYADALAAVFREAAEFPLTALRG